MGFYYIPGSMLETRANPRVSPILLALRVSKRERILKIHMDNCNVHSCKHCRWVVVVMQCNRRDTIRRI